MNPVIRNICLTSLLITLVLISGCGNDITPPFGPGSSPPSESASATIGISGGHLTYGAASLYVPAGAVSVSTIISLGIPEEQPSYEYPAETEQIDYVYEANPEDIEFSLPASVSFTYTDDVIGEYDESTLTIWSFGEDGIPSVLGNLVVNTQENLVIGTTDYLAYFVLTVSTEGVYAEPPPAPELIMPYDWMENNRTSVTFRWESSPGATYYHIQVSIDRDFNIPHYDEAGINGTLATVLGLGTNLRYYWRIQAINSFGESSWSEAWTFVTGDGSNPESIEGTWKFDRGEAIVSPGPEMVITQITSSGNLILSLGNGYYDVEGVIQYHERYMYFPEEHEYYSFEIDDEGTYTIVNDSQVSIPELTLHPEMTTPWYENYKYEVVADTLILTREVWYTSFHLEGPEVTYYCRI